jgi:hypothetical protein
MATSPVAATTPQEPRLASGLGLIGEYPDCGYREAPHLLRRRDGRFAQLSELRYLIVARGDGRHTLEAIAPTLGARSAVRGVRATWRCRP